MKSPIVVIYEACLFVSLFFTVVSLNRILYFYPKNIYAFKVFVGIVLDLPGSCFIWAKFAMLAARLQQPNAGCQGHRVMHCHRKGRHKQ